MCTHTNMDGRTHPMQTHTDCVIGWELIFARYSSPFDNRRHTCYPAPPPPPSVHHPPSSVPLPLWFLFVFVALNCRKRCSFLERREQFIEQRRHQKLTLSPLPVWKYGPPFFIPVCPPVLCPCLVCVFICMCVRVCVHVCKLSTEHKELQWHQAHSHCVLCLRSPMRCSV